MKPFYPFDFYIFRKPILPIDKLFCLLNQAFSNVDIEITLRELFADVNLQEALYYASPQLYERLRDWLQEQNFSYSIAFQNTLLKYLIRASTRCTPYGTFAGCLSPGHFAQQTAVQLSQKKPIKKQTRLRMDWVSHVFQTLENDPIVHKQLKFFPNDSVYLCGSQYRYTFYYSEGGIRQYTLCAIEATTYLNTVLSVTEHGATISEISAAFISQKTPAPLIDNYIHELISEQVLVSELQLSVTGIEPVSWLIEQLKVWNDTASLRHKLINIRNSLDDPVQHHSYMASILQPLSTGQDTQNIVHADLFFNTSQNTISQKAIHNLTKTLSKLLVLDQGNYNSVLEDFKKRFYKRYEEQEVPFLTVLDSDIGIGYGTGTNHHISSSPWLDEIDVPRQEDKSHITWNYWKDFILRKYTACLINHQSEIILSDQDLADLEHHHWSKVPAPATLTAFGNLIASSEEAIDRGGFLFNLYQLAGPSGASLLGRFCYGDEALNIHLKRFIAEEERAHPEVIFAEVVHLSEEKEGIVSSRPTLRSYEIPFLTRPSVPHEFQIPLQDLMVSVKNGQDIVLRSRKHNKRVIPRLSVAHNFNRGHHIYRFLGDVQFSDKVSNIKWHWSILEKQQYLPHVRYKNVILSRATWTLVTLDYPLLREKHVEDHLFQSTLRKLPHLPRYVQLVENDNELLIDLENPYTLALLKDAFRKKEIIILKEYLQMPSQCFLHDQAGQYTNELIIPFLGNPTPYRFTNDHLPIPTVKRHFAMGSEWLYVKLYTGERMADKLLGNFLKEFTDQLLGQELIDQWFFVRYSDPDHHLRIRFHKHPKISKELYSELLPQIHQWTDQLLQSGLIQKVQTDTYQREIERYGNDTIALSEALFFHDSQAVVRFLALSGRHDDIVRWQFAFAGIDSLLEDFQYDLSEKALLLHTLHQAYFTEFEVDSELKRQMDANYRKYAADIVGCLVSKSSENLTFITILDQRSVENHDTVVEVIAKASNLDQLLSSYIHMSLNRLFISNQRQHELLLYHYLYKYYKSALEKNKNLDKKSINDE